MSDIERRGKRTTIRFAGSSQRRAFLIVHPIHGYTYIRCQARSRIALEEKKLIKSIEIDGKLVSFLTKRGVEEQALLRNTILRRRFGSNIMHPLYKVIMYKYFAMLVRERFVWQLRCDGVVLKTFSTLRNAYFYCRIYLIQYRVYIPENGIYGALPEEIISHNEKSIFNFNNMKMYT